MRTATLIDWDALLPVNCCPADAAGPATDEATGRQCQPAGDADQGAEIQHRMRAGDNRRRCAECGNLGERGYCLAAQRGAIKAGRGYVPIRDILRRCEGFLPMKFDPDQRPGRDRWPGLSERQT